MTLRWGDETITRRVRDRLAAALELAEEGGA